MPPLSGYLCYMELIRHSENNIDITMDNQQETNNIYIYLVGSSETTRETYDYTLDDISLNNEFKL
jgi:hypothetical protein